MTVMRQVELGKLSLGNALSDALPGFGAGRADTVTLEHLLSHRSGIADPALEGRAVDFLDGEKLYVEACAVVVAVVTAWRIHHRRARRRAERLLKQS